eukprot:CAMPEP_0201478952 /NCGR_PEP_ID=MMETSP0151_2-20130828/3699_1 /ASSEMBLY_ACC=CAM_ASM_000257 /TAXON_ID=200890 /ORGANISM="Paramoeba atlantica, Strain 621/1 / CCAP 1560/9" /LENGTH=645 /DNA_ID=CAMNT_0047860227 /DNA_START=75 /DNA_END=2009 /DNA_ORIENTATION=+
MFQKRVSLSLFLFFVLGAFVCSCFGDEVKLNLGQHFESLLVREKVLEEKRGGREGRGERREEREREGREVRQIDYNDPLYVNQLQWHLQSEIVYALNISQIPSRRAPGVRVSPITWGVEEHNPDYEELINQGMSNFDGASSALVDRIRHYGTGGISAGFAIPNNNYCSVGVASEVELFVNNLGSDPQISLNTLVDRLFHNAENVDIFSYFVLFSDSQKNDRIVFPEEVLSLIDMALEKGRNGKGSILIPTGPLNRHLDGHCSVDEFSSSTGMLLVGAIDQSGKPVTPPCSSSLVVAPTNIFTTLSVACPTRPLTAMGNVGLASGVVALLLAKDNNLAWQDVHYVLMVTAEKSAFPNRGWHSNGAGRKFHPSYGYGIISPGRALDFLDHYESAPGAARTKTTITWADDFLDAVEIGDCDDKFAEIALESNGVEEDLQHVEVVLTTDHSHAGDLRVVLQSPSGTQVEMNRPFGLNEDASYVWLQLEDKEKIKMEKFDPNLAELMIFQSHSFEFLNLVFVTGRCCSTSPGRCEVKGGKDSVNGNIVFYTYSSTCSLKVQEEHIKNLLVGRVNLFVISEAGDANVKDLETPTIVERGSNARSQAGDYPSDYVFSNVLIFESVDKQSYFQYNDSKLSTPFFWGEESKGEW